MGVSAKSAILPHILATLATDVSESEKASLALVDAQPDYFGFCFLDFSDFHLTTQGSDNQKEMVL